MNMIQLQGDKFILTWKTQDRQEFMEILNSVKALTGAKFTETKTDKYWTVPVSAGSAIALLDFAAKYGFVLHADAQHHIEKLSATSIEMINLSLGLIDVDFNFGLNKELWPYQKQAVRYGILAGSHLNGDGPGAGKTPVSIAIVDYMNLYPVLVVTKKNHKIGFSREWQAFTNQRNIAIWDNTSRGNAQVDIIHHSMAPKLVDYIRNYRHYKAIIVDEVHKCANPKTQQTVAINAIAEGIPYRMGMSGNLTVNSLMGIYHSMKVIGRQQLLGNEWQFKNNFMNATKDKIWMRNPKGGKAIQREITVFSGVKNEKMLLSNLRANCFIGRKMREVDKGRPPLTVIYEDISTKGSDLSDEMKEYRKRLNQIADEMAEMRSGSIEHDIFSEKAKENIFSMYATMGRMKLPGQKEWLDDFLESGEKIVVFTYHQIVQQEVLSWYGSKAACLVRGQSESESQSNIDRFQKDKGCQLIICSDVAQEAVTLNAASYIALFEEAFTQMSVDQKVARVDRGTIKNPITQYHLNDMSDGSVDRIMMAIREEKAKLGNINSTKYFIEQFMQKMRAQ